MKEPSSFLRLIAPLVFLIGTQAFAVGDIGIGIVIGDPTGISFKHGLKTKNSIDGALAWSDKFSVHIHGTYLWNLGQLFAIEGHGFDWYTGVGARMRNRDDDHPHKDNEDDDLELGVRAPIGLRWIAPKIPLEVFAELSLTMNLIPETDADFDGGIGARWFF